MPVKRVRIVKGSCWPCKKRRIKCDLSKPACLCCVSSGATCDYNSRLIRWSSRPSPHMLSPCSIPRNDLHLTVSIDVCERRALDYFHCRVWPLLSASEEPCVPPTQVALEYRVVLLATCVLSESHRLLQDGKHARDVLCKKRLECLSAVRAEIEGCCADAQGNGPIIGLLFAAMLLYFDDGYMSCILNSASTSSHYSGILAILERLGGVDAVIQTAAEPLHMLISEFATTDLTTSMIQGRPPCFAPEVWDLLDRGPVWWGREPLGRCSLASVFREIASMSQYLQATAEMTEELSMERIHKFEAALRPVYAPPSLEESDGRSPSELSESSSVIEAEATHAFTLVRIFQHAALLYLYRAICGLPTLHPLVQQHVKSCLACIFEIPKEAKVRNCIIFPLFVAGAHVKCPEEQRSVLGMADVVYDGMRFASIEAVKSVFKAVWSSNSDTSWLEMFRYLSPNALVL